MTEEIYKEILTEFDQRMLCLTPAQRAEAIMHLIDRWGFPRKLLVNILKNFVEEEKVEEIITQVLTNAEGDPR